MSNTEMQNFGLQMYNLKGAVKINMYHLTPPSDQPERQSAKDLVGYRWHPQHQTYRRQSTNLKKNISTLLRVDVCIYINPSMDLLLLFSI